MNYILHRLVSAIISCVILRVYHRWYDGRVLIGWRMAREARRTRAWALGRSNAPGSTHLP